MQGVILAAGKGSRLQPITLNRSKAMLPILGKPVVERVMDDLAANGVTDFILVARPDDSHMALYFQNESKIEANVRFVYQPERLGTADALLRAAPLIEGDFILSACDNLISAEHVYRMLLRWESKPRPNAVLTLMEVAPDQVKSTGIVEMRGPWITRIVEKPKPETAPSNISSLPLYCFNQRILEYLPQVPRSPRGECELQDAIQVLIEQDGKVCGISTDFRLTLTSPADLLAINRHFLSSDSGCLKRDSLSISIGPGTRLIQPVYIESGAAIGGNCTIGPQVYIERDCRIGDGVTIQRAVILRQSVIPDGAELSDQVISKLTQVAT